MSSDQQTHKVGYVFVYVVCMLLLPTQTHTDKANTIFVEGTMNVKFHLCVAGSSIECKCVS